MKTPNGLKELEDIFGIAGNPKCILGNMKLPENVIHESQDQDAKLHFRCHELIDPLFEEVFTDIFLNYPDYFYSFGGCYNKRPKRTNGKEMSVHSWGVAVDLNVAFNPLGYSYGNLLINAEGKEVMLEVRGSKTTVPKSNLIFSPNNPIVTAFKKRGFVWGGDFKHTKDGMHFQFCKNY